MSEAISMPTSCSSWNTIHLETMLNALATSTWMIHDKTTVHNTLITIVRDHTKLVRTEVRCNILRDHTKIVREKMRCKLRPGLRPRQTHQLTIRLARGCTPMGSLAMAKSPLAPKSQATIARLQPPASQVKSRSRSELWVTFGAPPVILWRCRCFRRFGGVSL